MMQALGPWVADTLEWPAGEVQVRRIGTGHSRAMYVVTSPDGRRVVARVEQGGVFGTSSVEECRVMRGLHDAGFPVARIVADDLAGSALGRPLFLMEFVEGAEGADERLVDDATAVSFVQTLRRLHELDGASLGFDLVPSTPGDATRMQIDRWHAIASHAGSQPVPLLDEAAAWLRLHAPSLRRLAVVHGDAGPGNFVHREGMVAAMTDWEFAHLGDPAEDWSFCLTMRGSRTMPREAWLELFREHAGVELTDDQWRYWEAFNLFKGACANRTTLALFSAGVNRSPNMAIIGTALHQFFLRRLVDIIHA